MNASTEILQAVLLSVLAASALVLARLALFGMLSRRRFWQVSFAMWLAGGGAVVAKIVIDHFTD